MEERSRKGRQRRERHTNRRKQYFASRSQTGLNLLLIISKQKREGAKLQQEIKINLAEMICLDKFQVKGDYFLPGRFDICEEIFNGVLKCSPVVGFKCRGLSNI